MKKFLLTIGFLFALATVGNAQSQCVDVEEIDGSPKAPCIRELKVTNGTLSCPTVNRCVLTISGGGGGSPGGADTYVQINDVGNFNGYAGFIFDKTSKISLGVAGTSVGAIGFRNATSGTITLQPVTGALGTVTLSLPAVTDTLVGLAATQTLTNKTLSTSNTVSAALTWTAGVKQTFAPNGTTAGINVGSVAGDPSAPANGDLWYDSTANELTARINGANVALGSGGGGGITIGTTTITSGTNTRVLYNNAGVVGEYVITGTGNVMMSASPTTTGRLTGADANFATAVTTGTGATAGFEITANSLTTGNGHEISSSSVSSGNVVSIAATGTAAASNTKTALRVSTSGANATSTQTTYGARISNTSTGTSSTNYGLNVAVSGATTNIPINIDVTASTTVPAIAFNNETNAGFLYSSGGQFGILSAGGERIRVNVLGIGVLGQIGLGSTAGSPDVLLTRVAAAGLRFGAADAASPVAQTLSVQNVVAGTSNTAGATWTHQASLQTGNALPGRFHITGGALSETSATTQRSAVDRLITGAAKVLTNNSATTILNVTNASNTNAGGVLDYCVEVFDATDVQYECGMVTYGISNKGGVFSGNTATKFGNHQNATSGTLTVTFAISAANPGALSVNANSSLTPSTGYPRITYSLRNLTQQAVAVQ